MTEYVPLRGHTLLIPSGPQHDADRNHLFFVITDVCADGMHLLVPISSIKDGIKYDASCVLKAGCHEFITVDSFVNYRMAQTTTADLITKCVKGWVYKKKAPAKQAVLMKVCRGLIASPFTPLRLVKYFDANAPKVK